MNSLIVIATLLLLAIIGLVLWWLWPAPLARLFIALERRRCGLRPARATVDGIDWHYLEGGHGEPLILLHGFNADADHFCRVSSRLAAHFRIIAPDLPGFGTTRLEQGTSFRLEDLAASVLAWLDHIGIQHFYLGGSSMGGYIACAIARQAPERVRAMWLLAPGGLRDVKLSPVLEAVAEDRHNPLIVRDMADFERLFDYCFVHPPWVPGPVRRFLCRRVAGGAVQAQRIFDALRFDSQPLEDVIDGLATPTLVVWGQSDQVLNAAGARVLAERMSDAESLVLPNVGHLPMLESPDVTAEAWMGFTEALARRHQTAS